MLANFHVIVIFAIYSQFEAIQMLDSGLIILKTYIYIYINLLFYKKWKQN